MSKWYKINEVKNKYDVFVSIKKIDV